MSGKNLLLKTFFISLIIHIIGVSLFAIVMPFPGKRRKPIEVSMLPPAMSPDETIIPEPEIVPEIPARRINHEELAMLVPREAVKLSAEHFTGFSEYVPFTKISPEFEFPEFSVEFPVMAELETIEEAPSARAIEIEGLIGDRRLVHREEIPYPSWAQRQGIEGKVRIKFWVEPGGRISSTGINASSGFPELDIYAEENFRRWLFESAATDREVWGIITFRFRLK